MGGQLTRIDSRVDGLSTTLKWIFFEHTEVPGNPFG